MPTFVARRLLVAIPVLLLASVLVFVLVRSTTDPAGRLRRNADTEAYQRERERLGLDDPLVEQYTRWLGDFVRGDWGESAETRRPVSEEIRRALWNTTQLVVAGVAVSVLAAVAIGVVSALRRGSLVDHALTGLTLAGLSVPTFVFALVAIELLTYQLGRALGWTEPLFFSVGTSSPEGGVPFDYLRHLALPVLVLSVQLVAGWSRYQRTAMIDAMGSAWVRTARAKGLPRRTVVLRHGLRSALGPLVTIVALDIGVLFGGLVVTETIFSWPGMGRLLYDSVLAGDTDVLLAWLMVTGVIVIVANLVADVLHAALDPRVRLA